MLRILSHHLADGTRHMACDEALLAHADMSTLRTYTWDRDCCSLGYFQNHSSVRQSFNQDLQLVRRITGGGAILHSNEVTYCLIAKRGSEVPQRSADIFTLLHGAIVAELQNHGVDVSLNPKQRGDKHYDQDVRCFASPAVNDIMQGQAKMLGSAARSFQDRVLVHGSLKLSSNPWDAEQVVGCGLDEQSAIQVLTTAISTALKLPTHTGALSADEEAQIERYHAARYGSDEWLCNRQGPRACSL